MTRLPKGYTLSPDPGPDELARQPRGWLAHKLTKHLHLGVDKCICGAHDELAMGVCAVAAVVEGLAVAAGGDSAGREGEG